MAYTVFTCNDCGFESFESPSAYTGCPQCEAVENIKPVSNPNSFAKEWNVDPAPETRTQPQPTTNPTCCGVEMKRSTSPYDADGNPIKGNPWWCRKCGEYREDDKPAAEFPESSPTTASGKALDDLVWARFGLKRRMVTEGQGINAVVRPETDEEFRNRFIRGAS